MIITNKKINDLPCADPMTKIDIVLADENNIGISHCCHHMNHLTDIMSLDTVYKIDKFSFIEYLKTAYTHNPDFIKQYIPNYHGCKSNKKLCIFGGKTIKTIGVSITRDCNLACPMCNEKFLKLQYTDPKYKQLYFYLLNKIKGFSDIGIRLTGIGEPFFYKKETFDFLKNLTANDCSHVEAISNITMLNDDDILQLHEISKQIPIFISVSCSAITAETYKKVHSADFFNKVVNNIKLLNKYNLLASINFVIQPDNLHELEFYKEFWQKQNVNTTCDINLIGGRPSQRNLIFSEYLKYRDKNPFTTNDTINGKMNVG